MADQDDGISFGMISVPVGSSPIPGTPSVDSCLRVDINCEYYRAITAGGDFYGAAANSISALKLGLNQTHQYIMNNKYYFPSGSNGGACLFIHYHLRGGVPLMNGEEMIMKVHAGIIPLRQIDMSITNSKIIVTVLLCFRRYGVYDLGKIVVRHLIGSDLVYDIYKDRLSIVLFDENATTQIPTDCLQSLANQIIQIIELFFYGQLNYLNHE